MHTGWGPQGGLPRAIKHGITLTVVITCVAANDTPLGMVWGSDHNHEIADKLQRLHPQK
jgi:hypothetical protein